MSLQLPFFFPREAAVVWYQQGTSHHLFEQRPTSKKEVMENEKFYAQTRDNLRGVVERSARILFDHLGGAPKLSNILDIGSGLGLLPLSIYRQSYHKPTLYLVDGIAPTGLNKTLTVNGGPDFPLTSDPRAVADFMLQNGVQTEHLNLLGPSPDTVGNLRMIDFVVSTNAWMAGIPRETYWSAVEKVLMPKSMMLVDVASDEDEQFLRTKFESIERIQEDEPKGLKRLFLRQPVIVD